MAKAIESWYVSLNLSEFVNGKFVNSKLLKGR